MANKPIILHIAFILLLLNSCTSETEIPVSPNTLALEIKAELFPYRQFNHPYNRQRL